MSSASHQFSERRISTEKLLRKNTSTRCSKKNSCSKQSTKLSLNPSDAYRENSDVGREKQKTAVRSVEEQFEGVLEARCRPSYLNFTLLTDFNWVYCNENEPSASVKVASSTRFRLRCSQLHFPLEKQIYFILHTSTTSNGELLWSMHSELLKCMLYRSSAFSEKTNKPPPFVDFIPRKNYISLHSGAVVNTTLGCKIRFPFITHPTYSH